MLDFYRIEEVDHPRRGEKDPYVEVRPSFLGRPSKDLMIRGERFYAIWDEELGLWCTDVRDVVRVIDRSIREYLETMPPDRKEIASPSYMEVHRNNVYSMFLKYCREMSDSFVPLDQTLVFKGDTPRKEDYATKRLPYSLLEGDISAYQSMMTHLFAPEELQKLEWAVGAILSGDSKTIQKFLVLFGAPGTGKSTYTHLMEKLFEGYTTPFKAQDLGNPNRQFAMSSFKDSPLLAIEHDGKLDQIQDNTMLNSIVSHDLMEVNEKHKSQYAMRFNVFLVLGTNGMVKISDAHSGLLRRLIDVQSTGKKHPYSTYMEFNDRMDFELGAIAWHCLEVYRRLGRGYYDTYIPVRMMYGTNTMHNFVNQYSFDFEEAEYITLTQAYHWYKQYCEQNGERYPKKKHEFGNDLKPYFHEFHYRTRVAGDRTRNVYVGFKEDMMGWDEEEEEEAPEVVTPILLEEQVSSLDRILADCPAQYATDEGTPMQKWESVKTILGDLDTSLTHYVRPPENHIVIDFDLTDENGEKSMERNLDAIRSWPPTYVEWSKSGKGIHLHYIYNGDVGTLSRLFSPGIEIKVFTGLASLRRRVSGCKNNPIAILNSGLPLREEKVITEKEIKSEKGLRVLIERNLKKEFHPATKPSLDFIHKILKDAYDSGLSYDVTDMRSRITSFAFNSTNQSQYCLRLVKDMKFASETPMSESEYDDDRITIFDTEVFPNLFVVCWKYEGDSNVVSMVNPTPGEIIDLMRHRLVGFNNRKYDNHILMARANGYGNEELYRLSKRIVSGDRTAMFGSAYNISYADIYDYLSEKKSLAKWQIEMGLHHDELGFDWDKPVPEDQIDRVVQYCKNDVEAEEAVRKNRMGDWYARLILSELSGLTPNHTTNSHSAKIIFGKEKHPHSEFVYTDLSERFPGYIFEFGKSEYRGMDPSEGGFVYAEPGLYENVSVFDIESMHPASIIALNLFGDDYTKRFQELVDARLAIKHNDISKAKKMLGGSLSEYLEDPSQIKPLSDALKIVINSVYGLTSASFDNPFRDRRNVDNIVAKRGALFMIDLLFALQDKGVKAVHIKTDSIKVVDCTPEIALFISEFGKRYGYNFQHEDTYEKFGLVNNAVFVGKIGWSIDERRVGTWEAVGAQFQHPYVYKMLFSREDIGFDDFIETKTVTTSLWLGFDEDNRQFIGRVGAFVPVLSGGGDLLREKDGQYHSATGAKGYKWKEAELERIDFGNRHDNIDMSYFEKLARAAETKLAEFGDFHAFMAP